MIRTRLSMLACAGIAAMLASAADAAVFSFSFTAPLANIFIGPDSDLIVLPTGDTARGSGTLTTEDADVFGNYRIIGVSGSFSEYDGGDVYDIVNFDGGFGTSEAGPITVLGDGRFFLSNIGLYDATYDHGIFFGATDAEGDNYIAFTTETASLDATFTVTQPDAIGEVPEPASWAMMIGGFGLIGGAMRRVRARVAFA